MKTSDRARLLKLQRRIFRSLEAQAKRLLGPQPASIRRYEREFRRDFPAARHAVVDKRELIRAVRAADVTFVADFHTFEQAQRTALRIVREAARPGENWMIGLELVSSRNQRELDAFQASKLSLEEFLRAIRYREEWGFPWRNYAPLFQFARENGIRMIALNRPPELRELLDLRQRSRAAIRRGGAERDLERRDRWAAGVITDLFAAPSPPKLVVLYGELHVATAHLPAALKEVSRRFLGDPLSSIVVHQNQDRLYWQLARKGQEDRTEILQLRRNVYCVLSGTPWARLQSLVSWAEGLPSPMPADERDESAGPEDHLSMMRAFGETLSEVLGLEPVSWSNLHALTIEEASAAYGLAREKLNTAELRLIRSHVTGNRAFYLPSRELAYLASGSSNHVAELAAIHLLRRHTGDASFLIRSSEDFHRQALDAAFGFLGSLLINPRRKCDLPQDLARALLLAPRAARGPAAFDLQARSLALLALRPGPATRPLPFPSPLCAELAARYAGHILAKRLHLCFLAGKAGAGELREIFLPREPIPYSQRYCLLLKRVAPARAPKTKGRTL
ncbi:MAG: ChaN family lipoprotein [Oligoflexia bacterium]|nr:ChaN family lipoprotein [Oligoflexia bacterium]